MSALTKDIILTDEQEKCVEYDSGDLLVRGIAGSGKSVVLLERAMNFNRKAIQERSNIKIGIFTYVNTLVKYTSDIANFSSLSDNMIEVHTMDSYCMKVCYNMTGQSQRVIYNNTRTECIAEALKKHKLRSGKNHRFYDATTEFWGDEFKWIKEKYIKSSDEYINSDRSGRGSKIRMSNEDKKIAWEIYMIYCDLIKSSGKIDWEDIYTYIIDNQEYIPNDMKFDYVFVDEAQDLSLVKLKVAKLLSKNSITIAADQAQKIYHTSFAWKDVGIDIRGRSSKSLKESFRSTKQVIMLADSLLEKNKGSLQKKGEYTEPILPKQEGPKPLIICCENEKIQRESFIEQVKKAQKHKNNSVIGIFYRTSTEKETIMQWLDSEYLRYEEVKGKEGWSLLTPGIKLITLHSAKGLEVDTVIIPKVEPDIIPISMEDYDKEEIEDALEMERSLLYVGMTRAKHALVLLYSQMPSQFINEMKEEYYELEFAGEVTDDMLPI